MSIDIPCLRSVLEDLERVAPGAPLLALGQTVFWDEPMKAGLALASKRLGFKRRLLAGIHDTDYFAKLPSGKRQHGKFKAFPHNDGSTRGLWSAAGEFSFLFGSETVVSRETLMNAGLRVSKLQESRPNFLDEATEAWGWRGIVSLDEHPPVTAEVPLRQIFGELLATLDWALDQSTEFLAGSSREHALQAADELRSIVCEASEDPDLTVSSFYRKVLPAIYSFAASLPVDIDTTSTTELLRFNRKTCELPRFESFGLFVNSATREAARRSYDEAIRDAPGLYELARFGTGAIPFDLYIPGVGRGTIRLGTKGAVVMTHRPQFLSFRRPLQSLGELAEILEAKFGTECVVVGKAVSLIGQLAREFVFVFHEGASSYVKHSRRFHQLLKDRLGWDAPLNPILRIQYETWDSMSVCCSWLKLPKPLDGAFGTEEMCAPSVAGRWRQVKEEQENVMNELAVLRRPVDLIRYLDKTQGGNWEALASEYMGLRQRLDALDRDLQVVRDKRIALYGRLRDLKQARLRAEGAKGAQFRERIFEKEPTEQDRQERERLTREVDRLIHERAMAENEMRHLRKEQNALLQDEEVRRVHERRRSIEIEAELRRLKLIRQAVIASKGMAASNRRPTAWWFHLVCPDGLWFRQTVDSARFYLEPLS